MSTTLATPRYGVSETGAQLIWEAKYEKAKAYRAALDTPDGFLLVGFYCEHPLLKIDGEWTRDSNHYERSRKNKSGRKKSTSTVRSLSGCDYDFDFGADGLPICPSAQPMFVREVTA